MNGPEHYREAESSLVAAKGSDGGSNLERYHLAAAQVHATLALAAATALNDRQSGMHYTTLGEWLAVADKSEAVSRRG